MAINEEITLVANRPFDKKVLPTIILDLSITLHLIMAM